MGLLGIGPAIMAITIAVRALRRNALRASLTVLGILIGVAAVVIVTALGTGARDAVSKQIDSIGSNLLFIIPQDVTASGARGRAAVRLTEEDARAIQQESVSVRLLSPMLQVRAQLLAGSQTHSTSVIGARLPYFEAHKWSFARGETWTESDETVKSKVCVIGQTVRERLFGTDDPVGRIVRIGKYPYRVIGLLAPKGSAFGGDQDDVVVIPLPSLRARHVRVPPGHVHWIVASTTSADTTERAMEQIGAVLKQRHRIPEGREPDFLIRSQKQFQDVQSGIFIILTILLVLIAAISLVVGGIGVMNIMLVSVSERTREIGIRMAIGAREGDIRRQFLVEAVVLSLLGGIGGAVLGSAAVSGIASLLDWSMRPSPVALAVAFAVSGSIGIAFGFFPAHRASKLDPIVALRHE
jgi:putative ABC transport system permease protein